VSCTLWHQTAAWKAGHKKECGKQGAAGDMLALPRAAAEEAELPTRLHQLEIKGDSLGMLRLEAEALALAKKLRDSDLETVGFILNLIALSHYRTGGYARACELFEEARALYEALGGHVGMAAACGGLGNCYFSTGDYGRARELHEQHRAICEAHGDREGVATACCNLGTCYFSTGGYGRARELFEQARAMYEALGDRAGVASVCANLGNCYYRTGDYGRARELHEQDKAICAGLGDRAGVARACANLGNCHRATGDYRRARELHEQARALCEALGDRAGLAGACGRLGCCHYSMGDFARARKLHEQQRELCEALGDRAGVATACGNLGSCYESKGDYARALELHEERRAIAEALGDRPGLARACGNLARCWVNTGDYARAISHYSAQYKMAKEQQAVICQADAALGLGVALRLLIRARVRGRAAGASDLPGFLAATSACGDESVREAGRWLKMAVDLGQAVALLHLACLAFDAGDEQTALAHLQDYLSSCVRLARNHCEGCNQTRGAEAHMLTCGGCRVARFCSAEHQKMASRDVSKGGSLVFGRHKDVCGLLGAWRQRVLKEGESPDLLRADLLGFLRANLLEY
jgi:tetratricopeptide (TPR) repeat protein